MIESIREYPSYGIAVLGLIQPLATARIAVDSQGVLLASGHRREAVGNYSKWSSIATSAVAGESVAGLINESR